MAGTTRISNPTNEAAGLPGRPKTRVPVRSCTPNQSGPPGWTFQRWKTCRTPSASSAAGTRSRSPRLTPPERTRTSVPRPLRIAQRSSSSSSTASPRSTASAPARRAWARRRAVLEFRTCPGSGVEATWASSVPVPSTATRGRHADRDAQLPGRGQGAERAGVEAPALGQDDVAGPDVRALRHDVGRVGGQALDGHAVAHRPRPLEGDHARRADRDGGARHDAHGRARDAGATSGHVPAGTAPTTSEGGARGRRPGDGEAVHGRLGKRRHVVVHAHVGREDAAERVVEVDAAPSGSGGCRRPRRPSPVPPRR